MLLQEMRLKDLEKFQQHLHREEEFFNSLDTPGFIANT